MQNTSIYTDNSSVKEAITEIPTKINDLFSLIVQKSGEVLNSPSAEEFRNIDWSSISKVLATISIFLIIALIFAIAMYLFRAIGLYVMAKREGKDFAWLAFIPIGCLYVTGKIVGKTKIFGVEIDHTEFLLPILLLASCLPHVCTLCSILFILVFYALLYRLYQTKSPNFAGVLIILSILIPVLPPFIIFAIRKK